MLTRNTILNGLKFSTLMMVALVLCSGQMCAPAPPTPDVLGSDPPTPELSLDGAWMITYDANLAPDCIVIVADTVISYDFDCNGTENLVASAPIVFDEVGPVFTLTLELNGSVGPADFLLTPAGDVYRVEFVASGLGGGIFLTGTMSRL